MRVNINLASQPYEAAREFRRRMGMVVAALAVAGIILLGYIIQQRLASRGINRQISEVNAELDSLGHEKAQAQAILSRPANRVVADQSQFLNELFARKALSWTHVFSEMERIMPYNIHVVSMKPEYTKDNQLLLHMVVATDSRDRAVELVRRMEKSSHFRQPQVVAEDVLSNSAGDQGGVGGGSIQFDIAAIYIPTVDDTPADVTSGDASGKPAAPSAAPPAGAKPKVSNKPTPAASAQVRGAH